MLGVSLFISCKNKIQCVCVEKKKKRRMQIRCYRDSKKGELAFFLELVVQLYEEGRTLELGLERWIGLQ